MTSASADPDYPWLYARDELDLLEEDFERVEERAGKSMNEGERAVAREQREAMEAAEEIVDEAVELFGDDHEGAHAPWEHTHTHEHGHESDSLVDYGLMNVFSGDPLFQIAQQWGTGMRTWVDAQKRTEMTTSNANTNIDATSQKDIATDLFRLSTSTLLVPARLAWARENDGIPDPVAMTVAWVNYELAGAFLASARAALDRLQLTGMYVVDIPTCMGPIKIMQPEIRRRIERLDGHFKRFRWNPRNPKAGGGQE